MCRGSPTDWSSNADGGSWTFNLRKGVKFSDGSPLPVDDVMYTYQYILTNNTRAKNYIAQLKQIYKLSDTRVRMDLTQPMSVWPRAVNIFPQAPVGSGPYSVVSVNRAANSAELNATPQLTRRAALELCAGRLELDGDLVDAIRRELRERNLVCWRLPR